MSAVRLIDRLEDLRESLPKEGLKEAKVISLISRLASLVGRINDVASEAECVASARGRRSGKGETALYITNCAGVYAASEAGSRRLWKVGSQAFAARITGDSAEIEDEEVGITVRPGEVVVRILAGGEKRGKSINLTDVETIYSGYNSISYVLDRLEAHLRAVEYDLAKCARESGVKC